MRKKSILICIMLSVILFIGGGIVKTSGDDEHIDVIDRSTEVMYADNLFI